MDTPDNELLRQFVRENAQDAFRQLVDRHTHWLYSACLRRLHDPARAQDATQATFIALAQKAPTLLNHPTLSLWLHQAAKFACNNIHRAESRRAHHESEAALMTPATPHENEWPAIANDLEPALDTLPARDRQTLLLRFYEQCSHAQIAATLRITEAAAHKRLARALDRLRTLLLSRGHNSLSAAALPALLLSHAVTPAPTALLTTLAATTAATTPAHLLPITKGILHMLTLLKLKTLALTAAALVLTASVGTIAITHALAQSAPVPATAPAASAPSPLDPVFAVHRALANGDAKAFAATYIIQNDDEAALDKLAQKLLTAQSQFLSAYHDKLDPTGKAPLSPSLIILNPVPEDTLRKATITYLDQNNADVTTPDTAHYRVKRIPGDTGPWLIQISPTIASIIGVDLDKALPAATISFTASLTAYTQTLTEINSGKLTTPDAALAILSQRLGQPAPPAPLTYLKLDTKNFGTVNPLHDQYLVELDPAVKRTPASNPANHIKSLVDAPTLPLATPARVTTTPAEPFRGKRIRATVWIKTIDIKNFANPFLSITDAKGRLYSDDSHTSAPIHGTTDWTQYQLVADVPATADTIIFGTGFTGTGELWSDDFEISVVSTDIPTTDNTHWSKFSPREFDYTAAFDPAASHNGHPAVCLAYTGPLPPTKDGAWALYGRVERSLSPYVGHRLRISLALKSENASRAEVHIVTEGPRGKFLTDDDHRRQYLARGTTDWTTYSVECDVPKDAQSIILSAQLGGRGKLWIDPDSLTIDILDPGNTTP